MERRKVKYSDISHHAVRMQVFESALQEFITCSLVDAMACFSSVVSLRLSRSCIKVFKRVLLRSSRARCSALLDIV